MKTNGTLLTSFIALSIVAVGCGSTPDPVPVPEKRVVTTTTVVDDGYGYKRRPNERLYEAPVKEVRAIVGPSEQRCWMERQDASRGATVGGAVAGAVVGGILGHQVGSGRGNDVATVGGAVAGGAIGAQAGKSYSTREVKRCETVVSDKTEYYDVKYEFNGVEHQVQMTDPPGRTVTVNGAGEPRV